MSLQTVWARFKLNAGVAAWLRQRIGRIRRERIEVATLRLLEIRSNARGESDRSKLEAMAGETDDLAAGVARQALRRAAEPHTLAAAALAVDAARSTVARRLGRDVGMGPASA